MEELYERGAVRSGNSPISDFAEQLVAGHFGVEPLGANNPAADVLTPEGERIQVKGARRPRRGSAQLSAIRRLEEKGFDSLIAVLIDRDFSRICAWQMPISAVERHARKSSNVNGHVLRLTNTVLADSEVQEIDLAGAT
jgi:hypothetical protein